MKEQRPKLEVPVSSSFRDLQEVQVTLMFDTPKEFEGKYGPTWIYTVESAGTEYTLFASKALHRQMSEHNPVKGTVLSIARVGQGKETKWDVVYVDGPRGSGDAQEARERAGSTPPAPRPQGPNPQGFADGLSLYWASFDYAMKELKGRDIEPQVDANAVAFVVYKLAKDNGIVDIHNPSEGVQTTSSTTADVEQSSKDKMQDELTKLFNATGLHETQYMQALNHHAAEGQTITSWDDVTREVGLAAYATAKNVEAGLEKWESILSPGENPDVQDDIPF